MSDDGYTNSSPEDRTERLERRVSELEALLKGLTDEMLDMKAVVMKIKKDQRPAPVIQAVTPPAPSRNKAPRSEEDSADSVASAVPSQPPREKVTLKMQPDGTLAPVRDTGEDIIIASARDARLKGKDGGDRNRSDLIIAEDVDPTEKK
ncbi:DUF7518 family protein [Methanospirillum lacunae]|uniref:Uncharacterized protein n=1 Tax=Methanospirillum lacunae TaxID=668570 RepID=A0A2V2N2H9_9EURY|nr:hypothetical protein [Methanospirillum lacunae]PWR71926.1 hypothetical protein DK846_07970 [Methanospirillum lacunae]